MVLSHGLDTAISSAVNLGKSAIGIFTWRFENIEQIQTAIKKVSDYSIEWNKFYEAKDFEGMEKSYKNMQKYLKEIVPLESTLKEARTIENLHNLVKSKGIDFNLTEEEITLAEKLVN